MTDNIIGALVLAFCLWMGWQIHKIEQRTAEMVVGDLQAEELPK